MVKVTLDSFSGEERKTIIEFHNHLGNVDWDVLEEFILKNQHIARPIIGHCFETWFDKLINKLGHKTKEVGGDKTVDRLLNNKTLQLKTPYKNGTKKGLKIAYSLHKTHGKEKRPDNLYKLEHFADFLVGWINNRKILICPKNNIPKNGDYPNRGWKDYLADPVDFDWENKWINRFGLLGVKVKGDLPDISPIGKNILFPKLGKITELSDMDIIKTILKPENFRVWEQNLKGSIREIHFMGKAKELGIELEEPSDKHKTRTKIKVDFIDPNGKRIQVKGRTKNLCRGNIICVEVKGSHGRIPQRLYKKSDFDFLAVVLDPGSIPKGVKKINHKDYNFIIIPVNSLPIHPNSRKKVYEWTMKFKTGKTKKLYSIKPKKIGQKYDVKKTEEWNDTYLKDIFCFDVTKVKLNNFSLIKPRTIPLKILNILCYCIPLLRNFFQQIKKAIMI